MPAFANGPAVFNDQKSPRNILVISFLEFISAPMKPCVISSLQRPNTSVSPLSQYIWEHAISLVSSFIKSLSSTRVLMRFNKGSYNAYIVSHCIKSGNTNSFACACHACENICFHSITGSISTDIRLFIRIIPDVCNALFSPSSFESSLSLELPLSEPPLSTIFLHGYVKQTFSSFPLIATINIDDLSMVIVAKNTPSSRTTLSFRFDRL